MSKLLVAGSFCALGLFAFSLLGRYFFLAELISNFRCQILVVLLLIGVSLLLARRWWLGALVGLAAIWSMNGVVSVYWPSRQPQPGAVQLKIMSFNVLITNRQYEDVLNQVRAENPDVLALLEYSNAWDAIIPDRLVDYPYQVREPRLHGFGIALFSKHPLGNIQVVPMSRRLRDNPSIIAEVEFNGQSIRVASVHSVSPVGRDRLRFRNQQFIEMAEFLSNSVQPTVVLGDFNCVPWSPFLGDFLATTQYRDSRQGFGYQATWHTSYWPLQIPIDHAFVSPDINVHDRRTGQFAGSDHLPIVVVVSTTK